MYSPFSIFLHSKYGLYKSQIITVTSKHSITAAHCFLVASHQCCNLKGRCCLVAICIFVCCARSFQSFLFSFLPQTKHWQRFQAAFWFFASIRYLYIFVWFLNFISTIPCVESMTKNHHVVDGIGRGGLCLRKHNIKEPTECYKCVIVIFIW